MNGLERRRYEMTISRWEWHGSKVDWRRIKRREREVSDPVYEAYVQGQANSYMRHPIANPYPPGRRHDEFERGAAEDFGRQHSRF
jgi:hypothetical protein